MYQAGGDASLRNIKVTEPVFTHDAVVFESPGDSS